MATFITTAVRSSNPAISKTVLRSVVLSVDSLCGLVVRVPEVPGSIPGAARFSEKYWVWNRVHTAS
jgi:hypothetical protein